MNNRQNRNDGGFEFDKSMVEITDQQFDSFMDRTAQFGMDLGLGKPAMMPCIMAFTRPFDEESQCLGDIEVIVCAIADDFIEHEKKRQYMRYIGAAIRERKVIPVAVFMISEAWMSSQPATGGPPDTSVMPSKDPNKKEAIMISGRTTFNDCARIRAIIVKRDAEGLMQRDAEMTDDSNVKSISQPLLNQLFVGFFSNLKAPEGFFRDIPRTES